MSDKYTVGTCGNCGGPVEQYRYLHIVGPFPPPKCSRCGATSKNAYGPKMDMEPAPSKPDYADEAMIQHLRKFQ